ncbi:rhomboid family intramembrane serine protease [Filimonas effusa]|uniref:Rhomboid family intramembrane serine protease n=1 Tax=Filimonas effusa TaxID=2508721 RepID=A0A4V1MA38_9BACT|nr:rhomboid family intramembrane serine protease [Filimonas effusa]RXK83824.1 rhomboid family intramembrane serine protease [Filimonas effusa]
MTEIRPGRFEILPTVIKNLLIINVLVFIAQLSAEAKGLIPSDTFALHTWQSPYFKPWQFVTHMFMHGSWGHLFSNMFVLWMFGSLLENLWGPKRFLLFYMACGLGAAFCHMVALYIETNHLLAELYALGNNYDNDTIAFVQEYGRGRVHLPDEILAMQYRQATLGASGAVMGCLAAFGYLFPNTEIYLYFFIPIKAKWFVILYAAGDFIAAVAHTAGDNVAHIAHLGGALVGFILVYFWNKTNRRTFY